MRELDADRFRDFTSTLPTLLLAVLINATILTTQLQSTLLVHLYCIQRRPRQRRTGGGDSQRADGAARTEATVHGALKDLDGLRRARGESRGSAYTREDCPTNLAVVTYHGLVRRTDGAPASLTLADLATRTDINLFD